MKTLFMKAPSYLNMRSASGTLGVYTLLPTVDAKALHDLNTLEYHTCPGRKLFGSCQVCNIPSVTVG